MDLQLAPLGSAAAFLAFGLAIYGAIAGMVGASRRDARLQTSARLSAVAGFIVATAALVVMQVALLTDDFSVSYVANTSRIASPTWVKVVTMWAALEGSILLWAWLLSAYTALLAVTAVVSSFLMAVLAGIQTFDRAGERALALDADDLAELHDVEQRGDSRGDVLAGCGGGGDKGADLGGADIVARGQDRQALVAERRVDREVVRREPQHLFVALELDQHAELRPGDARPDGMKAGLEQRQRELELAKRVGLIAADAMVLAATEVKHRPPGAKRGRARLDGVGHTLHAREIVGQRVCTQLAEQMLPLVAVVCGTLHLQHLRLALAA